MATDDTAKAAGPKTTAPAPAPARPRRMKVRATQDGYYDNVLRRTGDVFYIDATPKSVKVQAAKDKKIAEASPDKPADFSAKWMEPAPADTPERTSTNNDVLRREHDATLANRAAAARDEASGQAPAGHADVLGD